MQKKKYKPTIATLKRLIADLEKSAEVAANLGSQPLEVQPFIELDLCQARANLYQFIIDNSQIRLDAVIRDNEMSLSMLRREKNGTDR